MMAIWIALTVVVTVFALVIWRASRLGTVRQAGAELLYLLLG